MYKNYETEKYAVLSHATWDMKLVKEIAKHVHENILKIRKHEKYTIAWRWLQKNCYLKEYSLSCSSPSHYSVSLQFHVRSLVVGDAERPGDVYGFFVIQQSQISNQKTGPSSALCFMCASQSCYGINWRGQQQHKDLVFLKVNQLEDLGVVIFCWNKIAAAIFSVIYHIQRRHQRDVEPWKLQTPWPASTPRPYTRRTASEVGLTRMAYFPLPWFWQGRSCWPQKS
jgi:hypothetical protein